MTETTSKTFIAMRHDLRYVPQRGSRVWQVIIEDRSARKFYRVGRKEYVIASVLDGEREIPDIIKYLQLTQADLEIQPHEIEAAIKWFMQVGLASIPTPGTIESADSDGSEETTGPAASQPEASSNSPATKRKPLIDPFSFRIPLLSGPAIESVAHKLTWMVSWFANIVVAATIVAALFAFAYDPALYRRLSYQLFVPEAAIWWALAWIILKVFHELGHAVVSAAFGVRSRGAGIAFFYLAPVPYVDTTDTWRLPNSRSRALCAAAGMWFELFLASLACLGCQYFSDPSLQYLCTTTVTLGTLTTIAFNANPLMRYDGYYIVSDLLNKPNLWSDGQIALKSLWNKSTPSISIAIATHGVPMMVYGLGCLVNRYLIMIGLGWGVWATWRGVGLLAIGLACYLWFFLPYRQRMGSKSLLPSKQSILAIMKPRIIFSILATFVFVYCLGYLPSPLQPYAPGIVTVGDEVVIRPESDGVLVEVFQDHNSVVKKGEKLIRLENPELTLQLSLIERKSELNQEKIRVFRVQNRIAELQAERSNTSAIDTERQQIVAKVAKLTIVANVDGRFSARTIKNQLGMYCKTGAAIGSLVTCDQREVDCSITQRDYEFYRGSIQERAIIYLDGQSAIAGTLIDVQPRAIDKLEHPVLAAKHGGPIPVHLSRSDDSKDEGLRTQQPRFAAKIAIDREFASRLAPGQLCRVQLQSKPLTVGQMIRRWIDAGIEWIKPMSAKQST